MKLIHRVIVSPVFKIIGTYEFDIKFENSVDDDLFSLRIELFQALNDEKLFRYKSWRSELFRIQSTFPQDDSGQHKHDSSDETILIEFSVPHFGPYEELIADNPEEALRKIIQNLSKALEHITSEGLKIK